jgi:lysophospholipase L1-like esterase
VSGPAGDLTGQPVTVQQLNPSADPAGGTCQDGYASGTGFQGTPQVVHDSVDLSQFDNQTVQLQFSFSTGDNLYDEFEGWFLKNIQVTGTESGSPVTVFSDPVTAGDTLFAANSQFGTSPGWHVTDSQDATLGGAAWWYGDDATGTYQSPNPTDTCTDSSANSGVITSQPITLPSNSQLSFDTLWQIESINPSAFDLMQVQVIPAPGPVLGLGDSVAAGYGLGPSEGNGDNPGAYPNLLGQALGVPSQDDAVEGACASSTENNCKAQSMDYQISHVTNNFSPGLITMTVGANDIDFAGCFEAILSSDLSMQSPSDPCNPGTLATHLNALQTALGNDLTTLSTQYPDARVLAMHYYNPLPQPPSPTQSPCLLDQVAAFQYDHSQGQSWKSIVSKYVLHHGKFVDDARFVQTQVYNDAENVLGQLNNTIDTTVGGSATVIDTSDFTGHDMCAKTGRYVFAPDVTLQISFLGKTYHKAFGGEVCPDPVNETPLLSKTVKFTGGSLKFAVNTNCTPHPTPAGQAAIASDFLQQG